MAQSYSTIVVLVFVFFNFNFSPKCSLLFISLFAKVKNNATSASNDFTESEAPGTYKTVFIKRKEQILILQKN